MPTPLPTIPALGFGPSGTGSLASLILIGFAGATAPVPPSRIVTIGFGAGLGGLGGVVTLGFIATHTHTTVITTFDATVNVLGADIDPRWTTITAI